MEALEALGTYLQQLMKDQGYTQQALSRATTIPQPTLSRLLRGRVRDTRRVDRVCRALGVEPDAAREAARALRRVHLEHAPEMTKMLKEEPMDQGPVTLAIANEKGGVGKTTMTINLAAGFQALGKRVLVVDLDPQGSATKFLGVEGDDGYGLQQAMEESAPLSWAESESGIPIIPGGYCLGSVEKISRGIPVLLLKRAPERADLGDVDVILLDTRPGFGTLTMNALVAADHVVIPVQTQPMAVEGVAECMETIEEARQVQPRLRTLGIVPNMVDNRRVVDRDMLRTLRSSSFGAWVTDASIRHNVSLVESYMEMSPVLSYAPGSAGAKDYTRLTRELMRRMHGAQELS